MPKQLNNKILDERLNGRFITRLEDYINSRTKIKFQCLKDGHIWSASPSNILCGYGCPMCAGNIKLNNDIIDERLGSRTIKRIGNYINSDTKIKFQCLIDGHIWESPPNFIVNLNRGCPKCSRHIPITNTIIDERLINKSIKRVGDYISLDKKIKWKCLIHSFEWEEIPSNILYQSGACPICNKTKRLSNELVDQRIKDKFIKRLEDYKNSNTKIWFMCLKCNYKWKTLADILYSNHGCPNCANRARVTNEIIDEKLKNRPIKRLDNSLGSTVKIRFKCLNEKCKMIWKSTPSGILNSNYGCPSCSSSKGEKMVKNLLIKYNYINFCTQHYLIRQNNKKYYVDFYIEKNGKIIIIEYNGIQHYKPICFNGITTEMAEHKFIKQKKRDFELKQYCESIGIKFIEISYTQKIAEVENIIKKLEDYLI